jgi:hypothetical protein
MIPKAHAPRIKPRNKWKDQFNFGFEYSNTYGGKRIYGIPKKLVWPECMLLKICL